jgi:drug/metabolite transporter (DMT)-like permease
MEKSTGRNKGIAAALSSALFLGMVPIFGKQAIAMGFSPFAVISIRSSIAAVLMLLVMILQMRRYFYIYTFGLLGCFLAGFINGLGSILYYCALSRLDAGVGHMLYSLYPFFVALWLLLDHQTVTKLTVLRLSLTIPAVFLLILPGSSQVDLPGALMMLGSAVLFALHMLINQRILYEAPAPTVTLYTLLSMAVTVDLVFLFTKGNLPPITTEWWPVLAMALITFFSRLALFMGIKHLGGLQTALLGLAELLVTIFLAQLWLGEHLAPVQWIGAGLLSLSLVMVGFEKPSLQKRCSTGWLAWLNPPRASANDFPWRSQP